jgi:RimJ/RimL family protein N-acetyltransferase
VPARRDGSTVRSYAVHATDVGKPATAGEADAAENMPCETWAVSWEPPEPELRAGSITLRPFRVGDASAVADACAELDIQRYTFMPDDLTPSGAREWISRSNQLWASDHARLAIADADDDGLLGQVGARLDPRYLSAEMYYWLAPGARGRGVASAAVGLLADWVFARGAERLFALVHPGNGPSNRLAARLGFTREGLLRAYEPFKGGRPDLVSWSLLPSDPRPWRAVS